MAETFMTIREMCNAFDVTARTLRFYEAKELLFPERRGTRRLFTKRDRARLKLILKGKRFGFSLEEIRQILDMYDPHQQNLPQMERAYEMGLKHLAEFERRRDELDEVIADLRSQLEVGSVLIQSVQKTVAA